MAGKQVPLKHRRNVREMGRWLARARVQRGHRQQDVADAIGRSNRYVSDVERGYRGHRMDPVIALLWCDYLVLEPTQMFAYLGLGDVELARWRVQHYMETGAWAHRFMQARALLRKALPAAEAIAVKYQRHNVLKAEAFQVRDAVRGAIEALRVPQTSEEGAPEEPEQEQRYG